ncbi:MAG: 1,4-alpha-glucan branching protein GlgB [bacterium]
MVNPTLSPEQHRRFRDGEWMRAYEGLGAHPARREGESGTRFAVWAPAATAVSVVGPFNDWDPGAHPLKRYPASGLWAGSVPGTGPGTEYMYHLLGPEGETLPRKADPYAFRCSARDPSISEVWTPGAHAWSDGEWMANRRERHRPDRPISIYEVHAGSWRRRGGGQRHLTWKELARELIPWVRDRGFTHIELLPVTEHPFYGSWGYQPTSLFAPTARYGPPGDLQLFIDRCHREGIGVILDWVPGHFPEDPWGLAAFDGTPLYEYADPLKGRHPGWETLVYDYGRPEVAAFLISSALFWLDEYHIDGLRVDAVASMLYLDFGREKGEWEPNEEGGNENLEAVAFLKRLNDEVSAGFPGAFTAAEESSAWPGVSRPTGEGGLGFGYKWNMGWMNDTLDYIWRPLEERPENHDKLTFGITYAFDEYFILPLSHDEVVYGKGALLDKMPGTASQEFAGLRTYLTFQYTYPGKKLLFMGSEWGQRREWDHDGQLSWHLLEKGPHRGILRLVDDLNRLYRRLKAVHEGDVRPEGFRWIDPDDSRRSMLSFLRQPVESAAPRVAVLCNFSDRLHRSCRVGVPGEGAWGVGLDTDRPRYGGRGRGPDTRLATEPVPADGYAGSLVLDVPPLSAMVLVEVT